MSSHAFITKEKQGTELLMNLSAQLAESLIKAGVDEAIANKCAWDAVNFVRKEHGGLNLYIPKGKSLDAVLQQMKIFEECTGNNHSELARKYGLSVQHVYRIYKQILQYKRENNDLPQVDMFYEGDK